ncbi:hypothetical protein L0F63_000277 [Massospora cicadina]|nr:hypothetical protein L0F63_000277 [Massospora cicadina]
MGALALFSPLQQQFGALNLMRWSFIMYIPLFVTLPLAKVFIDTQHPIMAWIALLTLFGMKTLFTILSFTSYNILLPESCESKSILGRISGLSQTFGTLMRAVGPYLCGVLWSWSLAPKHYLPLDYHFTFYFIACVSFVTYLVTARITSDMVAF